VEQSSWGSFVPKGRDDILTMAIGTQEHLSRVHTVDFGVGGETVLWISSLTQLFYYKCQLGDNGPISCTIDIETNTTTKLEHKRTSY